MAEGARLESVYRGNSIEGSNPSVSAKTFIALATEVFYFKTFSICVLLEPLIRSKVLLKSC